MTEKEEENEIENEEQIENADNSEKEPYRRTLSEVLHAAPEVKPLQLEDPPPPPPGPKTVSARFFTPLAKSIGDLLPAKSTKRRVLEEAIAGMFRKPARRAKLRVMSAEPAPRTEHEQHHIFPPQDSVSPSNSTALSSPMHPSMSLG